MLQCFMYKHMAEWRVSMRRVDTQEYLSVLKDLVQ